MTSTGPLAYLSGIGLLTAGAVTARLISSRAPGVNELLLAIVIGVVVTNTVGVPDRYAPGVRTHKVWLGAGIVLMGASLSTIVQNGPVLVCSVVGVTGFTLAVVEAPSRFPFSIADGLA